MKKGLLVFVGLLALVSSVLIAADIASEDSGFDLTVPVVWGDFDDVSAIENYRSQVVGAFKKGEYSRLEAEGQRCLVQKDKFPCGDWRLFHFYDAFYSSITKDAPPHEYEAMEANSTAWVEKYPESVTAWLARATFSARRGEYWSQFMFMSDADRKVKGQKGYHEGLENYGNALAKIYALDQKAALRNPHFWYSALLGAIFAGGTSGMPSLQQCMEAQLGEKNYPVAHNELLWYHSPLGRGSKKELDDFMAAEKKQAGPEYLFEAAAWLAWGKRDELFRVTSLDYEKVKMAYGKVIARTKSLAVVGRMAHLACIADDKKFAFELFGRLGQRYEVNVWSKFDSAPGSFYMRPYLQFAGVDDAAIHEAWYRTTGAGKDPKGLKRWNGMAAHAAVDSARIFSLKVSEAREAFDEIPRMPTEASHKVNDAWQNVQYHVGDSAPAELVAAIQNRREYTDNREYIALLLEKANIRGNSESDAEIAALARDALKLIGPGIASGADLMLLYSGEQAHEIAELLKKNAAQDEKVLKMLAEKSKALADGQFRGKLLTFLAGLEPGAPGLAALKVDILRQIVVDGTADQKDLAQKILDHKAEKKP